MPFRQRATNEICVPGKVWDVIKVLMKCVRGGGSPLSLEGKRNDFCVFLFSGVEANGF